MNHLYKAHHITLHVRESNKPAISLYRDNLGFEQTGVEKGYCESWNLVSLFWDARAVTTSCREKKSQSRRRWKIEN